MLYTNHQQNMLQIVEAIMKSMLDYVINKRAKAMIERKNQSFKM